jgi:hypothetical protein
MWDSMFNFDSYAFSDLKHRNGKELSIWTGILYFKKFKELFKTSIFFSRHARNRDQSY